MNLTALRQRMCELSRNLANNYGLFICTRFFRSLPFKFDSFVDSVKICDPNIFTFCRYNSTWKIRTRTSTQKPRCTTKHKYPFLYLLVNHAFWTKFCLKK